VVTLKIVVSKEAGVFCLILNHPINTTVRLRSVWRQRKTDNVSAVWQVYGSLTLAYFLPQAAIRQLTENCPKTARNRVLLSVFGQNLKYVIKATFGYEINEMSI
jgi:hypothetical protein